MIIILTLVCLFIDIGSKLIVSNFIEIGHSVKIIDNFLYLTYVKNTGAAWSIFSDKPWLVLVVSEVIILGIIFYTYKNKHDNLLDKIAFALIIGGAIGNFIDRVVYGYVIDFFDFYIFGYDYPIFNVADIFIVIGVVILMISTWRCKK